MDWKLKALGRIGLAAAQSDSRQQEFTAEMSPDTASFFGAVKMTYQPDRDKPFELVVNVRSVSGMRPGRVRLYPAQVVRGGVCLEVFDLPVPEEVFHLERQSRTS